MPQNTGRYVSEKSNQNTDEDRTDLRVKEALDNDIIDSKYGFDRVTDTDERVGYLINMHSSELIQDEDKRLMACVDYFFIQEDGSRFKVSLPFKPYLYLQVKKETASEVSSYLTKKYGSLIKTLNQVYKEDLDLKNHLVGLKQLYIKLEFLTVNDLTKVRKDLVSAVRRNREREKNASVFTMEEVQSGDSFNAKANPMDLLVDIREHDVPYHVRVSIDKSIYVGSWYQVKSRGSTEPPIITKRDDLIERPDCIVLAYDIETTKLPLKFPDAAIDQIMMISYMIDGQGYLICNREIISEDVEDFEYTPKPEFEGPFIIYNEANESELIQRFFDHILDVKPHIFVTYNGDFFDWPFVEARASVHGIDMARAIGFSKNREGVYCSRPASHMDAFCWVKRDSYLPVGAQNLKAAAKAKLRYDPVELDPEEMCKMAKEQPQVLANYSVSDAVATYYLYMKYVHPFTYALCTIIPMEPDEVLRKGSGTLCEALLCVEAFEANIVFPNKHETVLNKMTEDGKVMESETYVGGHVEAIESGVFRADIPCRFRMVPSAFQMLHDDAERCLKRAIEVEEGIPLDQVTNFEEVLDDIKEKLCDLRDVPNRLENPIIYHLDVGAMYPNIILTNRLQPSAMVDESTCAACDYNRPGSKCQRRMPWMWRGEVMPASRSEYHRIQQQLETEKFPGRFPGEPNRPFHKLNKEDQAMYEKKRLAEYCRKAYKKTHMTRMEERYTTICQKENSFYVDTVRAFRDRRYTYKGLCKTAKKEVTEASKSGDAAWLKSAKNKEVLYDSLQLAHKCILNSFYGYVMRKGARWYSMEMAGIVCYTGAGIIKCARELIEQIGRPLELDTDGIWCIMPASFPENYDIRTTNPKKSKVTISYPGAVLNILVQDNNTNDQYHELVDKENLKYEIRNENSVFFEVDGPYLSMILPASKEEGKKLKKRYAVFNFDKSLAELKGFEVKRRGELQIIKIFQSTVFEAFLKGDSLETCYDAVAKVADYWLDVLYSKGANMPDTELFELINENKSMSKSLAEYEGQKSTSISTAKRLAEFLGDQMVKDAGLSCRFIISKKPEGAPVTERAVPLAIFESEPSIRQHYLRRWLKDNSMTDFDIRTILDWDYYIERLSGTIMKIITIPAALQGIANPVPRVQHPDWLHKRVMEKTDTFKQRKINQMFTRAPKKPISAKENVPPSGDVDDKGGDVPDIEDGVGGNRQPLGPKNMAISSKRKASSQDEEDLSKNWRHVLGDPPKRSDGLKEWIKFQKKKWQFQAKQRRAEQGQNSNKRSRTEAYSGGVVRSGPVTIGGFLKRAQRTLLDTPWQIIQLAETGTPGMFKAWALVGADLHCIKINIPRVFYVNHKTPKDESDMEGQMYRRCQKTLPRSHPVYNLYEYKVPEQIFRSHYSQLMSDLYKPDIEGIYELQMPLEFRALCDIGCVAMVEKGKAKQLAGQDIDTFDLDWLQFKPVTSFKYMEHGSYKYIYFYQHRTNSKQIWSMCVPGQKKGFIFVVDTVSSNQMPPLNQMFNSERAAFLNKPDRATCVVPGSEHSWDIYFETDIRKVYKNITKVLTGYLQEKRGPTVIGLQSQLDLASLVANIPKLADMPIIPIHVMDSDNLYSQLEWQKIGARTMFRHYLKSDLYIASTIEHCRYFHVPAGNLPKDTTLFGADLFYARFLRKQNFVLWASPADTPDFGGKEADDSRLQTDQDEGFGLVINNEGFYKNVCVELDLDAVAVNTLLQSQSILDLEGTAGAIAFDAAPQANLEEMLTGGGGGLASYDETALAAPAFRVLRTMVATWLRDVSQHKNVFADYQIVHFYRWLRTPKSLLYDPALRKTLVQLMKKLLLHLVAEFKRLGAIIIFADFNRIIINTKKRQLRDASAYVDYIASHIRNKEIFHCINISLANAWDIMLWADAANFSGVKSKPEPEDEDERTLADEEPDEEPPEVVMAWNMSNYLPEEGNIRANFSRVVIGYLTAVHSFLEKEKERVHPGETPVRKKKISQTPARIGTPGTPGLDGSRSEGQTCEEYCAELVGGELSQRLFGVVEKINKKFPETRGPESESLFPILPGSHIKMNNPSLEFIKALCKVLDLDSGIKPTVTKLRRNLLRLINVGEFAPAAEWQDPCISFVLPEVICKSCNYCRDLDLCKDSNQGEVAGTQVWLCPNASCQAPYDTQEIESMLLDCVQRKVMTYILQDLSCTRCGEVTQYNLADRCRNKFCAGDFKTTVDLFKIGQLLKTFFGVANHYNMPLLKQQVEFIFRMNSDLAEKYGVQIK